MNKTILIVEDEMRMRKLLKDYLKREGFKVLEAEDGDEGLHVFKTNKVHLLILDVMMPKLDGFEVCKEVRNCSDVPIIMLTAKSEDEDKLIGFDLGADDYVTKPFSPKVLVARVKTLIKRVDGTLGNTSNTIILNGLTVNFTSKEVLIDDSQVILSPKEFDLLEFLIKNKGIVLSRDTLLDNVWGFDYFGDLRTVDTHIKRLREKLQNKADFITTVRGSGYKFEVKND
ncbi:DNA-binding response regulator, OmpR family, contains REC and winged-helix (wHTH) domain [Clostridium collagenovorans DSM 3089]|uniref:Stage 0 sporulation protein A homolog n=1 Tax=Clostridium collagenovorans DSM 3089 TaxID=1121306 RepID=A0A1M5YLA7_9CLOT|nr:response regulator transcription factor [Clostridium collagenovorans]SHI12678.1 DNA-binding response regulator, OmpR family, contains REC and winged-helix (wHTH) domain [Clostridium collagenovorans DSM 3089]